MFFGFLNVHKPSGITSRTALNHIARLVKPAKAGHAGTLDPLATGVLVVALGPATRLVEYVQQMPKQYRATFLLGQSSPTDDVEGQVSLLPGAREPTFDEVQSAAVALTGTLQQRPPAYSAIKVAGRRSYALARKGEAVELAARTVTVYRLDIERYEYPELTVMMECSSGTYVRSIGRDLGERLGTAAVMSSLVRTRIGSFDLARAFELPQLSADSIADHIISPLAALTHMPQLALTGDEVARVQHGLGIERADASVSLEIAALDDRGRLVAILARRGDDLLWPTRCFPNG